MANFIRKTSVPNLSTLKLANASGPLQDYFHKVMMDLDKQPAGGLLIVNDPEGLDPGTLAQFVTFNNITIDCIELPATHASYNTFSWQWATSIEEAKRKALGEYPKNSYVTNAIQAPEKAVSSLC